MGFNGKHFSLEDRKIIENNIYLYIYRNGSI